jgi:transcriptional regulator with XRE-family HTH domain
MSKRVKLNAAKIVGLRIARGWDAETFARRAELSKRTITSVESEDCDGVSPFTLTSVARALNVPPEELVFDEIPRKEEGKRIKITIEVPEPYDAFDETIDGELLINAIRAFLKLPMTTAEIVGVREGSTIVDIEIDEGDARTFAHGLSMIPRQSISSYDLINNHYLGVESFVLRIPWIVHMVNKIRIDDKEWVFLKESKWGF